MQVISKSRSILGTLALKLKHRSFQTDARAPKVDHLWKIQDAGGWARIQIWRFN